MALTVNEGTQTDVYSVANAGTEIPIVKLDIGGGTAVSDFGGTLPVVTTVANVTNGTVRVSVGTIATGTLQNLVSGTINALAAGTITNGTVQIIGIRHADEFATVVTSGTSTLGTIRAAVTGSAIYVTGLVISVTAASNVEIASGGTSTLILGSLFFAGSAGAVLMPIDPPLRTASGSALVYKQSANTGLSITAVGYVD